MKRARVKYIRVYIEGAVNETVIKDAVRELQSICTAHKKAQCVIAVNEPANAHRCYFVTEVGGRRVLRAAAKLSLLKSV